MDKSITLNFLPIGPADYNVPCFYRPVSSPTEARQYPDDYLLVRHNDSGTTKFWLAAFFDRFISGQEFSPAAGMQALRFEEYCQMPSCTLHDRTYVFQGGQQSASRPYFGIRSFGPYRKINDAPTFVFVFRNDDRDAARFLYFSLLGSWQNGSR